MSLTVATPFVESEIVRSYLSQRALELLGQHNASTTGDLLQLIVPGDGEPELDAFIERELGLSPSTVRELRRDLLAALPESEAAAVQAPGWEQFVAGVAEATAIGDVRPLPFRGRGRTPIAHSLVSELGRVRDQGRRGSCVPQSLIVLVEHLHRKTGLEFSPQFLYRHCKRCDGHHGPGTHLHIAVCVLRDKGVCLESTDPYNGSVKHGNEGHEPAPPGSDAEGRAYRCRNAHSIPMVNIELMLRVIAGFRVGGHRISGRALMFAIKLFRGFMGGETARTGKVLVPLPGSKVVGHHAMAIVGYRLDPRVPGGGYFIVRNSWGVGWARENPDGPGTCHIPFAYFSGHAHSQTFALFTAEEAAWIEGEPDAVPAPPRPRSRAAGLSVVACLAGAIALSALAPEALRPEPLIERPGCYAYWPEGRVLEKRVMPAETLSGWGSWFEVPRDELADWNGLSTDSQLTRDDRLVVHLDSAPRFHRVEPGDTLSGIQERYGIDNPWKLKGLNCMDDDVVYVGETLLLL